MSGSVPEVYDATAQYKEIIDSIPIGFYYSTPAVTTTVPLDESAAQKWTQRMSFSSVKIPNGILSWQYSLAWVVQTTTDQVFLANIMGASWWSPKWVKDSTDYATYVCSQKFVAGTPETGTNNIRQSSGQYIASMSGKNGSSVPTQGTALTQPSDAQNGKFAGQYLAAQSDWYSHICGGFTSN